MNISRFVACALLVSALPAFAQPDAKPGTDLPYPKVTPEDAAKMGLTDKSMQFHLHDVTLSDALDLLQAQSGVPIDKTWSGPNGAFQKKLSLALETRSFSEAFDAILKAADVKAYLQKGYSNKGLSLIFGEDNQFKDAPLSGTGGFQLRVESIDSVLAKSVFVGRTAGPNRSQTNNFSVSLGFVSAPQLPIVGWPRIRLLRADDDKGRSLRPEQNPPVPGTFYNFAQQGPVPLLAPQADAKILARLEGIATYVLPSKHETWEVPDVLNAKNVGHDFQNGGQTLRALVQSVQKAGDKLTVNIRVNGPETKEAAAVPNPFLSFQQIVAAIRLTDAKGRALQQAGYGGNSSGNVYNINANFSLPPSQTPPAIGMDGKPMDDETPTFDGPIKLTFTVPTEFVQTQVPFSFHDLPLP